MYDIKKIREKFPMLNQNMQNHQLVFLDNASTTFKPQCVIDAINDYYTNFTSNSHRGDYDLCYRVDQEVKKCRETIASFINCDENEVVFTSGDTASLNLIAYGYGLKFLKEGDEIIISEAEHASNVLPWYQIAKYTKAVIKYIPLDDSYHITKENLSKIITSKTKIVSLAHVSNVLGFEINAKEMAKIAHKYGAIFILDGAQSVPHLKVDFKELDVDFITFSAHKMCGPTGVGALIGKYELLDKMDPLNLGGGMNVTFDNKMGYELYKPPFKFEAGTLPLAEIIGFKRAIEFILDIGIDNIHKHELDLYQYLLLKIKDIPHLHIINKGCNCSILTFNIDGVFAQDEATLLNSYGIAVRSGTHCVKMLPNITKEIATVRMSTYLYTSYEDIDRFIDAIKEKGDILDAYFK